LRTAASRRETPVGQRDRQRHEFRRLAAREAEHHALVTGPVGVQLVVGQRSVEGMVDALRDVRRLLVERDHHGAVVAVEAVLAAVVADGVHGAPHDGGEVDLRGGGDLPGDDDEAGGDQRLARDARGGVTGQRGGEDRVGDLVGHLVRMALCDRLGGEQVLVLGERDHGEPSSATR
jgi:hypothetical protein